ncbi:hypothetical protein [Pseudoalteromonas obscura]|uniref:Uncharacterized protein n=1 Tax=Pseudoalteromonas obscura TaxID=3048491 RepID=A0ABT7EK24_9GAMM|nr:hypothetical protein [Pseudoalteromonas sp. P94(2023)]MDK2595411.1 hypothetical protein [Pseudoalteromonas sp. P94(2023)]
MSNKKSNQKDVKSRFSLPILRKKYLLNICAGRGGGAVIVTTKQAVYEKENQLIEP